MKKFYLSAIVLLLGMVQINAQSIPIQVNNEQFTLNFSQYPAICVGINDTIDITINYSEWAESGDVKSQNWVLYGDLRFVSSNGASQFPTTRVVSPTNGYGKGRIAYCYSTGGCSSAVAVDIYKLFAPPQGLEIKGPECVVAGQEVVYSIDPILTRNLNDQIGIDTYKWNVLRTPRPPFVDSVLYVSGDRSSVTFTIKEVDPENPPYVSVILGQCNNDSITLSLGNSTPKPEAVDTMYVPVGREPFKVGVIHPDTSLQYTWTCEEGAPFSIRAVGRGDSAIVTVLSEGGTADCDIYVSATYRNIQCNTTADTMLIKRTWGSDVHIYDSTKVADRCYNMVDTPYIFMLQGDSIPIVTTCNWILPQGWEYADLSDTTSRIVKIYPTSSAQLMDSLIVRPLAPNDNAKPAPFYVYVKPRKIAGDRIMVQTCLDMQHSNRAYVDTMGMNLPNGMSFNWQIANATLDTENGRDTIWFTPTDNTNMIVLTPLGISGCDGDTSRIAVYPPPVPVSSILSGDTCLFEGNDLNVTLSISNPIEGQIYHWSELPGWNRVYNNYYNSGNDSSIVTYSTNHALHGNYPVSVYSTGDRNCSSTPLVTYTIVIDTINESIDMTDFGAFFPMFAGQYGFALHNSLDSAIWIVDGVNKGKYKSITVNGLPQTVRAIIKVNGCNAEIVWHSNRNNAPKRSKQVSNEKISIYPNPANSDVRLDFTEDKERSLFVFDATGTLILNQRIKGIQSQINMSSYPSGNYYFFISDGDSKFSQQVIIQH